MKVKLDENLPIGLAASLKNLNHDVHSAQDEGLSGHTDRDIWETAQNEQRLLITQDMDFSDSRRFIPGSHSGILLIRLRSPDRREIIERVEELFRKENVNAWTGCFVVATERKLRVLKPSRENR